MIETVGTLIGLQQYRCISVSAHGVHSSKRVERAVRGYGQTRGKVLRIRGKILSQECAAIHSKAYNHVATYCVILRATDTLTNT